MPPTLIVDPAIVDASQLVADLETIRRVNPQRHEMEQLTAIVLVDREQQIVVGYKDVGTDEFWVRGHLPDYPLLPGVLICEAAAQLCSYYVVTTCLREGELIGFGGLENVRFRSRVRPGDRLLLVAKAVHIKRRHTIFTVQGFVGTTMVFHGDILGMLIQRQGAPTEEE